MSHTAPTHPGGMDITQLGTAAVALVGVLVVALVAVVPHVLDWPADIR